MTLDELENYGMAELTDEEVESFLSSHSLGVLGLPTENVPYLIPMSYGYEGGVNLYFFFVSGTESRKEALATAGEQASFLVYSAETMFQWRSVLLEGSIRQLSGDDRAELTEETSPKWRPELFEQASESERTQVYEFDIEEWSGIKHTGLPPSLYRKADYE